MNLNKLREYLEEFSIEELKGFLGVQLSELMVEWFPYNQPTYTHANLSNTILSVHGAKILENRDFRNRLVRSFSIKDINSFKDLMGKNAKHFTPQEVASAVAKVSWKPNEINKNLLQILEISENVFEKKVDDRLACEIVYSPSERFYELLDYQFAIRQSILSYLGTNIELAKMIVRMPTGTGKTKTAIHTIIHHYIFNLEQNGLVIWLAHTKELLEQAYSTFVNVWSHIGNGPVPTYKMWDKFDLPKHEAKYNGFMFCGIQKLNIAFKNEPEKFAKIANNCVLVVVDEAHRVSATKTKRMIDSLVSKPFGAIDRSLIGLTATPGRSAISQEENTLFASMFENKIIDINTKLLNDLNLSETQAANAVPEDDIIKYFQDRDILSKITREEIKYGELSTEEKKALRMHLNANGYSDYSAAFLEKIAFNKVRNQKILERLVELNSAAIPTIVFACSVEHGKMLSAALTLQGIENGHVFGDMNSLERQMVIKRFKNRSDKLNVLINYEVLTTGFDATNIRCVFITRPTSSIVLYSQMLGRGLRGPKMGGNAECLLIDIDDNLNRYCSESSAFNSFNAYWK